jgi:hypothetical protein
VTQIVLYFNFFINQKTPLSYAPIMNLHMSFNTKT